MLRSWKVFGLALMMALGVVLLVPGTPGGGLGTANADVSNITPSALSFNSGGSVTVTVTATDDDGTLTLAVFGGTNPTITVTSCAKSGIAPTANCPANNTTGNGSSSVNIATGGIDGDVLQDILTVTATVTATCATNDTVLFIAQQDTQPQVSLTCQAATPTATATATGQATATPTITTTPQISTLSVTVSPNSIGCSGSAFVTVVARNAAGNVVPGGTISLSATIGSISPNSAVDSGQGVLAVLTAPASNGGTSTITASAGGINATGQITINCGAATSVPPTSAVPATGVQPPRTGDAGLLATSEWRTYAGLALLAASFLGAAGFVWARTRG